MTTNAAPPLSEFQALPVGAPTLPGLLRDFVEAVFQAVLPRP